MRQESQRNDPKNAPIYINREEGRGSGKEAAQEPADRDVHFPREERVEGEGNVGILMKR